MSSYVPIVIEKDGQVERSYDLFSRLLKDRIVFLGTEINDHVANIIMGEMLFLESENPNNDINFYINSPGGSVTSTLAIINTMDYIKPDVRTICCGQAASGGALILACGAKGKRCSLPDSRIMIHQPLGGAQGQATDMEIRVNEINRLKARINEILADRTGKDVETIRAACERDYFLGAQEAVDFGLIDEVMERK